jgi:hypothetical protein
MQVLPELLGSGAPKGLRGSVDPARQGRAQASDRVEHLLHRTHRLPTKSRRGPAGVPSYSHRTDEGHGPHDDGHAHASAVHVDISRLPPLPDCPMACGGMTGEVLAAGGPAARRIRVVLAVRVRFRAVST